MSKIGSLIVNILCNKGPLPYHILVREVYEELASQGLVERISLPVRFYRRVDGTLWSPEVYEAVYILKTAGVVYEIGDEIIAITSSSFCENGDAA